MKNPVSKALRGFTLIELLVVIAIIAVLAAAGFGAGMAAINKARRVKAQSSATAVDQAVNMFYAEYSSMPLEATTDTTVSTKDGPGLDLIKVLLGAESGTTVLNTKSIKFLNVKEGKGKKDGLVYLGNVPDGLYDPWGGPYSVIMDCDYNEQIAPAPKAGGGVTLNNRRVATWSDGADAANGGTGKIKDDVKTW